MLRSFPAPERLGKSGLFLSCSRGRRRHLQLQLPASLNQSPRRQPRGRTRRPEPVGVLGVGVGASRVRAWVPGWRGSPGNQLGAWVPWGAGLKAACGLSWRRADWSFGAALAFFCQSVYILETCLPLKRNMCSSSWPASVTGDWKGLRTVWVEGEAGFRKAL